jgi:VIT1/CCC1 family predicted Fe2+/Mn2+ transporter
MARAVRAAERTDADRHLDRAWLKAHLVEERREADFLGEIREAIFGAQDGVTSILIVVITVATATNDHFAVLIAGIAAALAEVISMGAGEYMSSKSQREIFVSQIDQERREVVDRPDESQAEVAYMLEREGLSEAAAKRVAAELAREPNVLLKTMVEKELGLAVDAGGSPLQGALILSGAFALAALVPISPFVFLPVQAALVGSVLFSAVVMFGLGVAKSRLTGRNPVRSGLEIVALVLAATAGGWLFGTLLPSVLGVIGVHG